MAKPTVEIGQAVRITEGGLQGCEGLILNIEQSGHGSHGSGKREWICEIRLTRSSRFDYSVDQIIKLWSYKLQPLSDNRDPNYLFRLHKGPKYLGRLHKGSKYPKPDQPVETTHDFICVCGCIAKNPIECPNCGRVRTCSECGSAGSFEQIYGTCTDCGEKYR